MNIVDRKTLSGVQLFYLRFILTYLRQHTCWPTYRQLDQYFLLINVDTDMEEVWKSMPPGLTGYLDINQLDQLATLTIPGIYALIPDADELGLFLRALQVGLAAHLAGKDSPQMSNEMLLQEFPEWTKEDITLVGLLLALEPGIWQSFAGPGPSGEWSCVFARAIRRYRGVETIEEYLAKRNPLQHSASVLALNLPEVTEEASTSPVIGIMLQQINLHPDIYTKCWNSYTTGDYDGAILNATKAIEVAVRAKAKIADDVVGAALIAKAFKPDAPLLRYSQVAAEQEGMMALLRGIIMVYKNPQSHRFVGIQDAPVCLGILLMCSSLLSTIDGLGEV